MDIETKSGVLTKYFDPSISSQRWNRLDNTIYYRAEEGDCKNVYRYNPKNKKFEKLPLKEDVIRSFSIAKDALWATYTGVSASNSTRSYLLNLKTLESTLISDPYAEQLNNLNLGEVMPWNFTVPLVTPLRVVITYL